MTDMEYRTLGSTGLRVSLLSLGTLSLGPLQAKLSPARGSRLIRQALKLGVNLIDTAELYDTYPYIKAALEGEHGDVLVASRSYAVTSDEMECSVKKAAAGIGRRTVDLFMLHQQESGLTLKGHRGALQYLVKARKQGIIRAVGISTHHIAAVRAAITCEEVDFVFVPLNFKGLGIQDGTVQEMIEALEEISLVGKGIMVMKPLGGGHLGREVESSFRFLSSFRFIASVTVGVQNIDELTMDYLLLRGRPVPHKIAAAIEEKKRSVHIEMCQGCGKCVSACPAGALRLYRSQARVDHAKCVLCGYCAASCPEFCIKVV